MSDKNLIEMFLKRDCSKQEAARIASYLTQKPDLLDDLLPENEWNQYLKNSPEKAIDEDLYNKVHNAIYQNGKRKQRFLQLAGATAAVLLIFIWLYFFKADPVTGNGSKTVASTSSVHQVVRKNTTGAEQKISLADNTIVILAAGSEIRYTADYNQTKRDVYLTGKAEFSVTKNKLKPFTVFCNGIATTALGTRFMVDGTSGNPAVILYEGKVVVKKTQDDRILTYLEPGDQTAFNITKNIFETVTKKTVDSLSTAVNNILISDLEHKIREKITDDKFESTAPAKSHVNAGLLQFQNQNLQSVLKSLAEKYNVQINYPTEIVSSINVFVSVDTTQSIEKILNSIAVTNDLEVKKIADNKYYITK